jgi:AcrR family transcriptional regulator
MGQQFRLKKTSPDDTRDRILREAASLFALQGFQATTLREITIAAQANLAAVNYHFRSKEELVESVIEAAIHPIVEARQEALNRCLRDTANPNIEQLAHALVQPLYELSVGANRNCVLLLMQLSPDPETSHHALVAKHFAPLHRAFVNALENVLPHLKRAEIAFRYDCARGSVLQTLVELAPAKELVALSARDKLPLKNRTSLVAGLVAFVSAGFSAQPVFKST